MSAHDLRPSLEEAAAWFREEAARERQQKFRRAVARYQNQLRDEPDLLKSDPVRLLDPSDFHYRFIHRHRFPDWLKDRLELIAYRLQHVRRNGKLAYFAQARSMAEVVVSVPEGITIAVAPVPALGTNQRPV